MFEEDNINKSVEIGMSVDLTLCLIYFMLCLVYFVDRGEEYGIKTNILQAYAARIGLLLIYVWSKKKKK